MKRPQRILKLVFGALENSNSIEPTIPTSFIQPKLAPVHIYHLKKKRRHIWFKGKRSVNSGFYKFESTGTDCLMALTTCFITTQAKKNLENKGFSLHGRCQHWSYLKNEKIDTFLPEITIMIEELRIKYHKLLYQVAK